MGHVTPSLGFVPDSVEDILARLRRDLENVLGFQYESDEEFKDTNLYRLFLGFATEVATLEDGVLRIIDNFVSWIQDTHLQIKNATSGTYSGIVRAFLESFKGVFIASGNIDDRIPPGIALVALDNTDDQDTIPDPALSDEEKQILAEIFQKNWPAGIFTEFSFENPQDNPPTLQDIVLGTNDHDKRTYKIATVQTRPLEIEIRYLPLAHAVTPNVQDATLKEKFLESFSQSNAIGRDFDPRSYLSTQNVPWLAQATCAWREKGSDGAFQENRLSPRYFEKFVVARDANTHLPLISVSLLE